MEQSPLDDLEANASLLETNARMWELRAAQVASPNLRELLRRRAVRGRKLAERLRKEAATETAGHARAAEAWGGQRRS